jgi:hypothetical protein
MSALENKNRPIMGPMITYTPLVIPLNPAQKLSISEWAVKTAMVLDSIYSKRSLFYFQKERDAMRSDLSLPPHVFIWLGRCAVENLATDGTDVGISGPDKVTKLANGNVCTFVVGHLAIQVLTVHWTGQSRRGHPPSQPGPWENYLIPIYPLILDTTPWPPLFSFDVSIIDTLHNRWRIGKTH